LIFIESLCTDENIISTNIKHKVGSGDPDYDGMDPAIAERDFRERIKHYEESYETIDPEKGERHLTWCKIQDVGNQVTTNRIETYLQSRIVFYLMNLHITPRSIFFTRVS
jgi:6-phosphofructo-2-kinase / fructose-2,6-biphosphatase 2